MTTTTTTAVEGKKVPPTRDTVVQRMAKENTFRSMIQGRWIQKQS